MQVDPDEDFLRTEGVLNGARELKRKLIAVQKATTVSGNETDIGEVKTAGSESNGTGETGGARESDGTMEEIRSASGEKGHANNEESRTNGNVRYDEKTAFRNAIRVLNDKTSREINSELLVNNQLTEFQNAVLKKLKKHVGLDAFFYNSDSTFGENGFETGPYIFIKGQTGVNPIWVYGHESSHVFQKLTSDIMKRVGEVVGAITPEQVSQYVAVLKGNQKYRNMMANNVDKIKDEMVADMFGNLLSGDEVDTFLTEKQKQAVENVYDAVITEFKGRAKTDYNLNDASFAARDLDKNSIKDLLLEYHNDDYQNNKEALQLAEKALQLTWQFEKDIIQKTDGQLQWDIGKNDYIVPNTGDIVPRDGGTLDRPGGVQAVRNIGIGITASLINTGKIDLRGFTARDAREIAIHAQVYRDPRFETLRIIYMKGDVIVGHEGITSRLPSRASAIEHNVVRADYNSDSEYKFAMRSANGAYFRGVRDRMRRLEADGFYMIHNHPSGDPTPSQNDINATGGYIQAVQGFKAHVIINSGAYHVLKVNGYGRLISYAGKISIPQGTDALASSKGNRLAPSIYEIKGLEAKFGRGEIEKLLNSEGITESIVSLTGPEARYLLKFRDVNSIRDRFSTEKQTGNTGLHQGKEALDNLKGQAVDSKKGVLSLLVA